MNLIVADKSGIHIDRSLEIIKPYLKEIINKHKESQDLCQELNYLLNCT